MTWAMTATCWILDPSDPESAFRQVCIGYSGFRIHIGTQLYHPSGYFFCSPSPSHSAIRPHCLRHSMDSMVMSFH
jgi:hypothetical protein